MTKRKPSDRSARQRRRPAPSLISTVIFDLDDTLYDCFGQRVRVAHRHAAQAMACAGVPATVEQIFRARMQAFRNDPTLSHIDAEVCRRFGVRDGAQVHAIAKQAYFSTPVGRSEEHTSELQSQSNLVCRLLLENKNENTYSSDQ